MTIVQSNLGKLDQTSIDPRPDLKEDHLLWSRLLDQASERNEELAGVLHGLRCGGTRIRKVKGRYILRPDVDPSGRIAWERKEDYEELRDKYLKPYTKVMIQLLGELGKESSNEQSTA